MSWTLQQAEELFPVLKIREPPPESGLQERSAFYDAWHKELFNHPVNSLFEPFLNEKLAYIARKKKTLIQDLARQRVEEEKRLEEKTILALEEVLLTPMPDAPEDMISLLHKMRDLTRQIREGPLDLAQKLMTRVLERRVDQIADTLAKN